MAEEEGLVASASELASEPYFVDFLRDAPEMTGMFSQNHIRARMLQNYANMLVASCEKLLEKSVTVVLYAMDNDARLYGGVIMRCVV